MKLRQRMRVVFFVAVALVCAMALPLHAQSPEQQVQAQVKPPAAKPGAHRKMLPVDEGSTDATWVQFRGWLLEVLKRGDRRALATIVDANILNSLEAPRGLAAFRKMWDLDGKDESLIRGLTTALQTGSVWYQPNKSARLLCAPYVAIKWPLDDIDPYHNGAIAVNEALIKGAPSHNAQTLGKLTYDIVEVRDWEVADREEQLQQRWVKIRHAGRDGYVPMEHIRSAIEHRACFAKTGAGWRLAEYVVGIEYLGGSE